MAHEEQAVGELTEQHRKTTGGVIFDDAQTQPAQKEQTVAELTEQHKKNTGACAKPQAEKVIHDDAQIQAAHGQLPETDSVEETNKYSLSSGNTPQVRNADDRGDAKTKTTINLLINNELKEVKVATEPPTPTVYEMAYDDTHGFAVIISNTNFQNPEEKREGNQSDEDNLSKTFQYLGYTVVIYQDCDRKEMVEIFKMIAKRTELEDHDSFVCCILSHGREGNIQASDNKYVDLKEITSPIKDCKALNGKPKMFFIQACRGDEHDLGTVKHDGIPEDSMPNIPKEADFFFGYATPRGYVARLRCKSGSYYIQALSETFCQYAKHASLVHMHTMINSKLADDKHKSECEQISVFESQLRKFVYFFKVPEV